MSRNVESVPGLIGFFASRPVIANLLMAFILVVGGISCFIIQKQLLPNFEFNVINLKIIYPGASAKEVDEEVLVKIENALMDVNEIKKSNYMAFRNAGRGTLQIRSNAEISDVLDKVKLRIDSITTLPLNMEPIQVERQVYHQEVIEMVLTGDIPLQELKPFSKEVEAELRQLKNVSIVELYAPEFEVTIEVEPLSLQNYGLSLEQVVRAVESYSNNFSSGQLSIEDSIVSIRTENQLYRGHEFSDIPVKVGSDGAKVLLSDIAIVKDDFVEGEHHFKFNGKNAIFMMVNATNEQSMKYIADSVQSYVAKKNTLLPEGIKAEIIIDTTEYLDDRLYMVLKNLVLGFIFVALMLVIFLRTSLALWVFIGLPVSFLGAAMLMPLFGVTFNIYSLFALILVLGIVVDDAIVVGEGAYKELELGGTKISSVVKGVKEVASPVTFGVLTTVTMFVPFMFSTGPEQVVFYNISVVVILCLLFSLVESKLILPAHIASTRLNIASESRWRTRFNGRLFAFIDGPLRRFVKKCLYWRWLVLSCFIAFLLLSYSVISSGIIKVVPNPKVPHDFTMFTINLNENVSEDKILYALKEVEEMVHKIEADTKKEFGKGMIVDILAFNLGRNSGRLVITFVEEHERPYDSFELSRRWRNAMPPILGLKSIVLQDDAAAAPGATQEFGYLLYGTDLKQLNQAGRELISRLQKQHGVYDIGSTIDPPSKEYELKLKPIGYAMGVDISEVSHQLNMGFYGKEIQRIFRDGEEVKVMLKYPQAERKSLSSIENANITTTLGKQIKLADLVEVIERPGVSNIRREGGHRNVYIWGSIDEESMAPAEVISKIESELIPAIKKQFPGTKTQLGGFIEEQQMQQLENILFFIYGIIIAYILLAISLNSFVQPFLVMSIIPFSLIGAVWGHLFFDLDISLMSQFGLIAAAGIVINDSLVLTDYINKCRAKGVELKEAVVKAVCVRFRPIMLTSITTFCGVLPIMFETSLMTRFITPMAVALGFSVLLAGAVTLILLPCLYIIFQDLKIIGRNLLAIIAKKSTANTLT